MKTLAVFLLICAVTALTNAAEAEPEKMMEEPLVEETFPEAGPEEMAEELFVEEPFVEEDLFADDSVPFQRSNHCPGGWSLYNNRCFLYVHATMTWAYAERNCQARGGNLASVHSFSEYRFIQGMIYRRTNGYPSTWLGGSDAQHEGVWLWSDGSRFSNINWCPGEPNNDRSQHCLQMNYGGQRCWDDLWCWGHRPFVCARNL
ncbi:galactose-specific lectin nattectin-like [Cheilinus undulatus]|uniref:galactose-specific lectin nattectin-like n=1 Tax=Cheilinus undulatus TaxID=241271 RepID=UPI001BD59692|nr:galactose-specific lectin nattectin-like [Cheilinus undulatus]